MFKKHRNKVTAAVFFALAAYLYIGTFSMVTRVSSDVGPTFFPRLIAVGLALLSVLLFFKKDNEPEAKQQEGVPKEGTEPKEAVAWIDRHKGGLTFLLIVLYAAAMKPAGFVLASTGYLFFQILLMAPHRTQGKAALYLLLSAGVSFGVYELFAAVLKLTLPAGILRL